MRKVNALFSAAHFFVTALVLFFALVLVVISESVHLCTRLFLCILENRSIFFKVGILTFVIGIILFITSYRMYRGRHFHIKGSRLSSCTTIGTGVVKSCLHIYCRDYFPQDKIHLSISKLAEDKIEILVEMPQSQDSRQIAEKISQTLPDFLYKHLDLDQEISFNFLIK